MEIKNTTIKFLIWNKIDMPLLVEFSKQPKIDSYMPFANNQKASFVEILIFNVSFHTCL